MVITDPKQWINETKQIQLPSGVVAKIRRIPTSAFLQLLDLGDVATKKPSEVARILIPACLVEPRIKSLDELLPHDVLALIDEIVKFSELDKIPFRPAETTTAVGDNRPRIRPSPK